MEKETEMEALQVKLRLAQGAAEAALRMVVALVGALERDGVNVPTVQRLAGDVASGSLNEPAISAALADLRFTYRPGMNAVHEARRLILSDLRADQNRKPSE